MNKRRAGQLSHGTGTFARGMRDGARSDRNPSRARTGFGSEGTDKAQLVRGSFHE
jgi:hypothetical protein